MMRIPFKFQVACAGVSALVSVLSFVTMALLYGIDTHPAGAASFVIFWLYYLNALRDLKDELREQ
jgi:hypothetical protein